MALWDDIIAAIEVQLGQPAKADGRFSYTAIRKSGARRQLEITDEADCLHDSVNITTVAAQERYTLPKNFKSVTELQISGQPLIWQAEKRENCSTMPTGTPREFYIRGNEIGFFPVPSAVQTIVMKYIAEAPMYLFSIYHPGAAAITAATYTLTATKLDLIITGGATAGTYTITFADAGTDTVAEIVAAINAKTGVGSGFVAAQCDMVPDTQAMTSLDIRTTIDCLPKLGENKPEWIMQRPVVDSKAAGLLVDGIVLDFKFEDRETPAFQSAANAFYSKLKQYANGLKAVHTTVNNSRIANAYGGRGRVATGSSYLKVWIP